MSEKIEAEVEVVDWEVGEYHADGLWMHGLNEDGERVVRRHYELQDRDTEVKNDDGEWVPLNDIDDGGFPKEARFLAFSNPEP